MSDANALKPADKFVPQVLLRAQKVAREQNTGAEWPQGKAWDKGHWANRK